VHVTVGAEQRPVDVRDEDARRHRANQFAELAPDGAAPTG
jgi:hypothetical protein